MFKRIKELEDRINELEEKTYVSYYEDRGLFGRKSIPVNFAVKLILKYLKIDISDTDTPILVKKKGKK